MGVACSLYGWGGDLEKRINKEALGHLKGKQESGAQKEKGDQGRARTSPLCKAPESRKRAGCRGPKG